MFDRFAIDSKPRALAGHLPEMSGAATRSKLTARHAAGTTIEAQSIQTSPLRPAVEG